ncbi:MAG: polymer-forming cytoskeletal protein [Bdellovibrionales bacterium]|nr:polymer-forming cytoskeletal protein [Bdellovibrionales bacterium]
MSPDASWSLEASRSKEQAAQRGGGAYRSSQTVLSAKCRISGRFEFEDGAEVHGMLEGEVFAGAELVIGETATVRATVHAQRLRVFGRIQGDVICGERLEAFPGAKIEGNISSPSVVLHDGVAFEGRCEMEPSGSARLAAR